jgi:hypothetical protein
VVGFEEASWMRWIATVSWIFDDVLRACCERGGK